VPTDSCHGARFVPVGTLICVCELVGVGLLDRTCWSPDATANLVYVLAVNRGKNSPLRRA
jgi:hypothetical protein